ncbi:sensor domain-containing diguanylate cyclase [Trabulsiella odontotermitis]|uniref:sensor domain-containing diguanylate cyclase n=1 Tax=Trabulsiella odontotermitis TaxID=379893 RepID=UPI0006BA25DC|nr:sensor domain-containing diguanylate cyclase [Trabulsiella odontotermitis]
MSDIILAQVSHSLSREQSLEGLVRQLLEMLAMVTDMETTYLTRIDMGAELQHIQFARNSGEMQVPEGFTLPWEQTLCRRAIRDDCFYSDEVDVRWQDCDAARALGIKTLFSTPVHLNDGSLYGTLCATSKTQHDFTLRGEHVLHLFAGLIARHIERESLVAQLREVNAALKASSFTDELTGLPNRRALFDHLPTLFSIASHMNHKVIVAFIDLDNFKAINDRYGHQAGDEFLCQVAARLAAVRTGDDIVARLGGDEFLFASISKTDGPLTGERLQEKCEALRAHTRGEYVLPGVTFTYPGASIGLVAVDPATTDAETALRAADDAMYLDKKSRRQTLFFSTIE